jgi:hypothetical protein
MHDTDTARTSPPTMTSATSTDDGALVKTAAARVGFSSLFHEAISTTRILTPDFLPEPVDLGRLRAVSKDMRDAVDATGREIKKLSNLEAAELGYLTLLKDRRTRGLPSYFWEEELGFFDPPEEWESFSDIEINERMEELKARRKNHCPWDEWTCAGAAKGGHLEILKWLRANDCPWDERTCSGAAYGGHLEVLQWGARERLPVGREDVRGAQRRAATWRCFSGRARTAARGDEYTCKYAAYGGHLDILKWARANGCPWGRTTCAFAAEGGHLEVLQWARENDCPWDERTCATAAYGGHLDVLKWARENGYPWDERTCAYAAFGGNLEVLKWARENGCPWNEWTCTEAAEGGQLHILKWARENGCPWDEETCESAARGGHLEVLKWLRANGCPWGERTCAGAAEGGHLEVLQWTRENGCPWDERTCTRARRMAATWRCFSGRARTAARGTGRRARARRRAATSTS